VNWFTAVNRCLANNGSLAVFDDQILSYFASSLLRNGSLWIGLIKSWWTWPDAGKYNIMQENERRNGDWRMAKESGEGWKKKEMI